MDVEPGDLILGPALAEPELDWTTLHCGTTNDFLRLADAHPELLRRI